MKQQIDNFSNYLEQKKRKLHEETKILNETYQFLRKNIHNNFILFDVARHFNITLKTARIIVANWIKFGFVEVASDSSLPKTYRILKIPDETPHQEEMK